MSEPEDTDSAHTDGEAQSTSTTRHSPADGDRSQAALYAQLEQAQAENRRLRRAYAAAQRTRYRRTAAGLYLIGSLSVVAALVVPEARDVLFALGATGLFAGVLTYYLTPEQFVAASISSHINTAHTALVNSLITDLGLQDTQVYVADRETGGRHFSDVLLFIPQTGRYEIPSALTPGIAVPEETQARGLVLVPTGGLLLREFERAATEPLADVPAQLAEQLTAAITDQFELAATAEAEVAAINEDATPPTPPRDADTTETASEQAGAGRLTIVAEEPAIDQGTTDHPIASFVAAGVAKALDTPATITDNSRTEEREGYRITVEWEPATQE